MIPCLKLPSLLLGVCALALGGCSAGPNGRVAGGDNGVRLTPDPAFAGAQIAVVFEDPNLRADQCRYEWRRNGSLIPAARTSVLDPAFFARNDRIEVAVFEPGSGGETGQRWHSDVRVVNTSPSLSRVTVTRSATLDGANLRAIPEALDRDGDPLTYRYRWFRNGVLMGAETGSSLPMASLAPGDRIAVEVVASDGESQSPPMRGEAAGVLNHPPHFTSQPTVPGPADRVFHYQAIATDEDGDSLRYERVIGPSGLVVDPNGDVSWRLPPIPERSGDYAIAIRALDSKGDAAVQQFTIRLAPPVPRR